MQIENQRPPMSSNVAPVVGRYVNTWRSSDDPAPVRGDSVGGDHLHDPGAGGDRADRRLHLMRFGDDLDVSPWKLVAIAVIGVAFWVLVIRQIPGV